MSESELLQNLLVGGGGVAGGGSIVYLVAKTMLERAVKQFETLQAEVKQLREEKVAELEERIGDIEKSRACAVHEVNFREVFRRIEHVEKAAESVTRMEESMKNMLGWMKKVDFKLETVLTDTSAMKQDLLSKALWMGNINQVVQDHVQDHEIHKAG